jgi:hypothetical protein
MLVVRLVLSVLSSFPQFNIDNLKDEIFAGMSPIIYEHINLHRGSEI